jgi:hypothetical protein
MSTKTKIIRLAVWACLAGTWMLQPAATKAGEIIRVGPIVRVVPVVRAPAVTVAPTIRVAPVIRGPIYRGTWFVRGDFRYWRR